MASAAGNNGGHGNPSRLAGLTIRLSFLIAAAFLLVGLALAGVAAAQLVSPDLVSGNAMLSYGRVFPAGTAALLFGWLTVAFVGVSFHAVPRLVGSHLAMPLFAFGALGLIAGGAAAGVAMILLGENVGGRWLEFPLFVDGALVAGYAAVAGVLVMTCRRGTREGIPLPAWYLVAGSVWLLFAQAAGAIPGLEGLAGEVQSAFTGAALFGMWAATAGVGVAYTVAAGAIGEVRFNERLGRIGFWSLAFMWVWTTARVLQFGPTKDWIETVPVVFGAGLVVAVLAIATDFAGALRGRWSAVAASPPLQMVVAGLGFLVIAVATAFVGTMRSGSAVLRFTAWDSGVEAAALLGAFTLFALAGIAATAPALRGRTWGVWSGRGVLWPVVVGAGVAVGSRLMAGVQQGLSWLAGVQTGEYQNFGDGFGRSLAPLAGLDGAYLVGVGLIALGAVGFALRVLWLSIGASHGHSQPVVGFITQPLRSLLRGAVAVFALGALGAFAFPAVDSRPSASVLAETTRNFAANPVAELGREVYVREGCWYCHTQQVRQVRTDLGLGPVSQPGDYAYDPAGVAGWRRIGPDLMHTGSRNDTASAAWVRNHLTDPRAEHAWSVMPSFEYLSNEELTALSVYVSGLE